MRPFPRTSWHGRSSDGTDIDTPVCVQHVRPQTITEEGDLLANEYVEQGFDLEQWPQREAVPSGRSNGVIFTFSEEYLDYLLSTVQRWFAERGEVSLLSYGTTDKRGLGCMVMEWDGCEIDQLFLDILRTDENVIDYAAYPIDLDEED